MTCERPGRGWPFLWFTILSVGACAEPVVHTPTPRELAIAALEANDYAEARRRFEELLVQDPDDAGLHLGAGLAAFGQVVDHWSYLTALLLSLSEDVAAIADITSDDTPRPAAANENAFLLDLVPDVLELLAEPARAAVAHLERVDRPGVLLELPHFRLRFLQSDFVDLSGAWRRSDAALILQLVAPWSALLELVAAHDLRFDVYYAVHRLLGPQGMPASPGMANMVVELLESPEYPTFLSLETADRDGDGLSDGRIRLERVRATLALAAERLVALSEWAPSEGAALFEAMPDGDDLVLTLRRRVRQNTQGIFSFDDGDALGDLELRLTAGWLTAERHWAENLRGPGDGSTLLTLQEDVVPMLVPVALALLPHLDLGDVSSLVGTLSGSPDTAVQLISTFLPEGLAFDPAAWLRNTPGLRAHLPIWRDDLPPGARNFLLEWECPGFYAPDATRPVGSTAAFPGALDCPDPGDPDYAGEPATRFDLVDADHFAAPAFWTRGVTTIAADGWATPWPILAFTDPSFSGLLWIDPAAVITVAPGPPAGLAPADNRSLNAWLGALHDRLPSF